MRPEQEALINKANESLGASKLLIEKNYYDFSVSRAYYSMFYIAQAFLLEYGLTFSKHSAVISEFGKRFVKSGIVPIKYHRILKDAEENRIEGDYEIYPTNTKEDALAMISQAEQFLELGKKMLGHLPPAEE